MDMESTKPRMRAKSAPPIRNERADSTGSPRSRRSSVNAKSAKKAQRPRPESVQEGGLFSFGCDTLEETVNRMKTTGRLYERLKARRRTDTDIAMFDRHTDGLAHEIPRRVNPHELDTIVLRLTRQTASSSARMASLKRPARRYSVDSPGSSLRYDHSAVNPDRFKGATPVSGKEMKGIVARLSSYDPMKYPADARRVQSPEMKSQVGPLASYRWGGVKHC